MWYRYLNKFTCTNIFKYFKTIICKLFRFRNNVVNIFTNVIFQLFSTRFCFESVFTDSSVLPDFAIYIIITRNNLEF